MSNEFFDEIITIAKRPGAGVNILVEKPRPFLDPNIPLYGSDAGEDYVRTFSDLLKAIIRKHAATKMTAVQFEIPQMGKMAQQSMNTTLVEELGDFEMTANGGVLRVSWEKYVDAWTT